MILKKNIFDYEKQLINLIFIYSDDDLPWARTAENALDTKYPYVCHAELNAILNKNSADTKGCSVIIYLCRFFDHIDESLNWTIPQFLY